MMNTEGPQISKSKLLFEESKRIVPGGVHSPVRGFRGVGGTPIFIESAEGTKLVDVDGNTYTDYCMSWGPLIFGHQDADVANAVREAMARGWSYGTAEPYSLELATLITSWIPWVEKIRFVNSGTEAVMAALRLARAATERDKILKFDGCYHGHVDSMLVRAGSGLAEMASPDSAGITTGVVSDTIVAPLNDIEALERVFQLHGSEIAAVIIEPLPANNGLLIQQESFLKKLAELAKKSGALLIFDEVISGFRMAFGGMAEITRIKPDLVTYGKVIGGGFPVGAYGGRSDLMDLIAPTGPVYQAGTLSANPIAMTAGLATLKKILKDPPYKRLAKYTKKIQDELKGLVHVQASGSMFWSIFGTDEPVRSLTDIPAQQKQVYPKVFHELLGRGIYLAPSGYEVSFLSTAHTESDVSYLIEAMHDAAKRGRP